MPQIYGYANNICVFHRLPNLDVLVRENLHLLPIVPEGGLKAVKHYGRFRPMRILERTIVSLIAQTDEDFFEIRRVVRLQLQLPVVDSVQGQWFTHHG